MSCYIMVQASLWHETSSRPMIMYHALQCIGHIHTVFRKKSPTHVFFYTFVENDLIATKFSGNV